MYVPENQGIKNASTPSLCVEAKLWQDSNLRIYKETASQAVAFSHSATKQLANARITYFLLYLLHLPETLALPLSYAPM